MANYANSEGLYRKLESPIVESVRQSEGLYKKVNVAKFNMSDLTESQKYTISELNSDTNNKNRIING